MSFKKNLETSDVSLTSFEVHKQFSFTERDSGSGVFAVPIIKGSDSNLHDFKTTTADSKTISGSTLHIAKPLLVSTLPGGHTSA